MGEGEEGNQGGRSPNTNTKDDEIDRNSNNSNNKKNLHLLNEKGASRKSCKGCLYYSSTLKSNSGSPFCVGISRTLPKPPGYYAGKSEVQASKEGRSLADFRYGCLGYSVYSDTKNTGDAQETRKGLPVCVFGVEVLVDRGVTNANSTRTHAHNKDNQATPQPRINRPAHPPQSSSDDFFSRFTRNANVVATGVAKNMRRVGNQIKESLEDVLYPYRRRPK